MNRRDKFDHQTEKSKRMHQKWEKEAAQAAKRSVNEELAVTRARQKAARTTRKRKNHANKTPDIIAPAIVEHGIVMSALV
ncbi:hypothetical protein PI125_g6603 [Phytophthora idaei]|nr:hypothetical protein PI125_g6603 [Phytophthora idaei]KAG3161707.1 hypothetical protein PI126_g6329 [Phytophthora idaei]